jgi:hypothetical protein
MSEHWRSDLGVLGFLTIVLVMIFLATLWVARR